MKTRFRLLTLVFLMGALVYPVACNDDYEGSLPRRDQLNYPIGLTFHPNGQYFYVVNSNFDARYRPSAGGTVSVIDAETLELRPEATPFLPSFGGFVELNADASKAYVTARRDDVVAAFDVAQDGSALFCATDDGTRTSDPSRCVIDRVPDTNDGAQIPSDPFGLAVFTIERNGEPIDLVNLSHLRGNRVSSLALPNSKISAASLQTAPLLTGGNAIAQRPGTENLYVAGRNTNGVAIFQPYIGRAEKNEPFEVEAIVQRGSFVLNHEIERIDARGLAFNDAGDRVYVVTQRPDALHTVKITPGDPDTGAGIEHKVVSSIPLPDAPTDIVLHTTPRGRRLAYVPSRVDESIQVLDIDSQTIVDEVLLDAGPYEIVIEPETSGCATPEERCRAFVTLFDDTEDKSVGCGEQPSGCGSVAVIDINPLHQDPDNPALSRYHKVIQKIR